MSERPELYWSPMLLPLRPCDIADLTPNQLLATYDFCEARMNSGVI